MGGRHSDCWWTNNQAAKPSKTLGAPRVGDFPKRPQRVWLRRQGTGPILREVTWRHFPVRLCFFVTLVREAVLELTCGLWLTWEWVEGGSLFEQRWDWEEVSPLLHCLVSKKICSVLILAFVPFIGELKSMINRHYNLFQEVSGCGSDGCPWLAQGCHLVITATRHMETHLPSVLLLDSVPSPESSC